MTATGPLRVVVAGFGMAGGRLVDDLLDHAAAGRAARDVHLTVVGAEPYPAYNRVLLSDVVAGRADVAALALADPGRWASRGVDVRLGSSASAVELPAGRDDGAVRLDDGTLLPFDRLVLATGAAPVVPALAGLDPADPPAGVHPLRTVDDAREIVAAAANARRAVVLGGGLLGLEAARGLARRGLATTVLHAGQHLLGGVLDVTGGRVLARALARLGVGLVTDCRAEAVTSAGGRPTGVVLAGGEHVPADLLVLACGVRPRTALATGAGLAVGRGVLVDDALVTSDPRVAAVGDCAEHAGVVAGLVAPAWEQARVVAARLSGADPGATYRPERPAVRLKAADVEVASVGEALVDVWDPGADVVQLLDPARDRYVKAVVRDGVVVGAAVVGDARAAAELRLLVERGSRAPADLATLLMPGTRRGAERADDPTTIPDRATICRCNGVTKRALVAAWTAGARTPADLARTTRATTGCGTCGDAVRGICAWLAASDGDEPAPDHAPAPVPDRAAPAATARALSGGSR